jgi:hypothetical protein
MTIPPTIRNTSPAVDTNAALKRRDLRHTSRWQLYDKTTLFGRVREGVMFSRGPSLPAPPYGMLWPWRREIRDRQHHPPCRQLASAVQRIACTIASATPWVRRTVQEAYPMAILGERSRRLVWAPGGMSRRRPCHSLRALLCGEPHDNQSQRRCRSRFPAAHIPPRSATQFNASRTVRDSPSWTRPDPAGNCLSLRRAARPNRRKRTTNASRPGV